MSDSFDDFWKKTLEFWKALPIQEWNFRKRIGLAPDKDLSRKAFEAMPKESLKQLTNMNTYEIATARISLRWHGRDIVKEVQIEPHQSRCFEPLHKDHDFPKMYDAHRDAMKQREERRALATAIGNALTSAIMEEVSSQDPRNGYTPAENREFYRENVTTHTPGANGKPLK